MSLSYELDSGSNVAEIAFDDGDALLARARVFGA